MVEIENSKDLVIEIQRTINKNDIEVITIDGDTGAGKSTLAGFVTERTGVIHLKLDSERYLHQNKGGCLKYIKYEILLNDIKELVDDGKIAFVDSVCILKILNNINVESDLKIYVKRLSSYRYWYDGDRFNYSRTAAEIIREEEDRAKRLSNVIESSTGIMYRNSVKENTLHDEIIEYHFEYKPDETADLIYNRIENSG